MHLYFRKNHKTLKMKNAHIMWILHAIIMIICGFIGYIVVIAMIHLCN